MSNTISQVTTSSNSYVQINDSSDKVGLSKSLREYLTNSDSQSKQLVKSIKNLLKNKDTLSSLISTDTSEDAVSAYNNGLKNAKSVIASFNNIIRYAKSNTDDSELQDLYKTLKKYVKKESADFKEFGLNIQSSGEIKISDETKFKYSIAGGSFGKYLVNQSKSGSTFLNKILKIGKKIQHDNLSYLSQNTIDKINSYYTGNTSSNVNNTEEAVNNISGSTFSAYA